jgi:hypothetical protein
MSAGGARESVQHKRTLVDVDLALLKSIVAKTDEDGVLPALAANCLLSDKVIRI